MGLSFEKLREINVRRCQRWHRGGLNDWSGSDWAVALSGEIGEACNVIKKMNRERDSIKGSYATIDDLANELADSAMYLDLLAARYGINLGDAIISKFNATSERYNFPDRL